MELSLEAQSWESEAWLVEQATHRDKAAFTLLYDRYVEQIYHHVYYRLSNQADAEDVTEEVFLRAWKAIDRYQWTGAPFVAWLFSIARNLIVDHYRANRKLVPLEDEEAPNDGVGADPVAVTEAIFDRGYVREAIAKLKGDKRKVVLMRFVDGLSYETIAHALNKSEGAVRVIQYRALADLRHLLDKNK